MSAPVPPPPMGPQPPFAPGSDSTVFWPRIPVDNHQPRVSPQPDCPPFKKPRIPQLSPSNPLPFNNEQPRHPEFQHYNKARLPGENLPDHNNNLKMPPPLRGGNIFFKTRECPKFREGTCPFGMNCNFAHGRGDMREPPSNWQELAGFHGNDRMGKWEEDQKIIAKHRLCKNFISGRVCPYGDRCNYLHEEPAKFREDLGKFRESSAISISPVGVPVDNGARSLQSDAINTANLNPDASRLNSKYVPWKTRMCHKWMETSGHCPFGDRCHFAHGQAELKKHGGYNEVEQGNVCTDPPKPLPIVANDAPVNKAVSGTSCKNQVMSKFLSQWKGKEKISRIYADWIDDIPNTLEN